MLLYFSIILLFSSFLFSLSFGRFLGRQGIAFFNGYCLFLPLIFFCYYFILYIFLEIFGFRGMRNLDIYIAKNFSVNFLSNSVINIILLFYILFMFSVFMFIL